MSCRDALPPWLRAPFSRAGTLKLQAIPMQPVLLMQLMFTFGAGHNASTGSACGCGHRQCIGTYYNAARCSTTATIASYDEPILASSCCWLSVAFTTPGLERCIALAAPQLGNAGAALSCMLGAVVAGPRAQNTMRPTIQTNTLVAAK